MSVRLDVSMNEQPDQTTCGPTSLHAVYSFYQDPITLDETIKGINQFDEGGGTLGVILGQHALKKGYKVTIISYNINIFDPTWFKEDESYVAECLKKSYKKKKGNKKHTYALEQYFKYLDLGGKLRFEDLSCDLLLEILEKGVPILTGLSSTWLYRDKRENPVTNVYDEICGEPAGHFVVIDGHENKEMFSICDPYKKNPLNVGQHYLINGTRLINSILLGISSYDGNLLVIEKES